MDRLKETDQIREWLEKHRGDWPRFALQADVSMRTLGTIAATKGYQATTRIIRKIKEAQRKWK